jgi:hypothetical protein
VDAENSRIQSIRETKLARLNGLKGTISALRGFPNEVIAEIFSHLVTEPVVIEMPIDPSQAPWNISQVCSRWREVALSMPTLWNDVDIDYDLRGEHDQDIIMQKLGSFFARTDQSPISFTLCVAWPALASIHPRLTNVLAPRASQLYHFGIESYAYLYYIHGMPLNACRGAIMEDFSDRSSLHC